ncbi:MAG: YjbE family putative metal transport protein [Mycoplasmatales bacterium]
MDFLVIILELILTDIVFGGDNAVVIAMATKNLEPNTRKKASFLGALFAILLRVIFVVGILLLEEVQIYFINIIGGFFLVYIALSLIKPENDVQVAQEKSLFKAVRTIVLADAIMSLDNVMVIAIIVNSAHTSITIETLLVIFALLVSFPIILFGANILAQLIDKFRFIIYLMAFLLLHVALETILKDQFLLTTFPKLENGIASYAVWLVAALVLIIKVVYDYQARNKN